MTKIVNYAQRQFGWVWPMLLTAASIVLLLVRSRCVHAGDSHDDFLADLATVKNLPPVEELAPTWGSTADAPRLLTEVQIAEAQPLQSSPLRILSIGSAPLGFAPEYDRKFDRFVVQAAAIEAIGDNALRRQPIYPQVLRDGPAQSVMLADPVGMTDDDYLREVRPDLVRPRVLRSPTGQTTPGIPIETPTEGNELLSLPMDAPLGFTGPSSVLPREGQISSHFVPIEDRWRIGLPQWDRYGLNHPPLDDYPYTLGRELDPYHQNVLKGDYPIIGQHTFLNISAESLSLFEGRQVPTPTTPFESTVHPNENDFFGNPNQFFTTNYFLASFDLFHGDAAFKPVDWRLKFTPVFNFNYLDVQELAVVNPNVKDGTTRFRDWWALQEWFGEVKLADTSPAYDFTSVRVGSQPFLSDFRGFIFEDTNRAIRLFGTQDSNRNQFNIFYEYWQEKETNSELNTFLDRPKQTFIANFYRQDFIFPGYTTQFNFIYDRDKGDTQFDRNDFLVRPDPVGVATPHSVSSYYLGWTGDGHINRFNINHAFYWVLGRDTLNPIAGQAVEIDAQMAALELSYDRDWVRLRGSFFYASGDSNPLDNKAHGFDTIIDNPNFAGGGFSYWDRQGIRLLGVGLTQRFSLVPDLRSSKIQGQPNFVNPGLYLGNIGADFDVTPKLKLISNLNLLWFDQTQVLEQLVFQSNIERFIGTDLSLGMEYRPHLNNNFIIVAGVQGLVPGAGFRELYNPITGQIPALFAGFMDVALKF
jgi:hypothetical protein